MEKIRAKNFVKTNATLAMLALGVAALGTGCACHRPTPDGMGGSAMKGHHPPSPLMMVLDANHDGVIDAEEISNAPAALRMLDKNGDGQLTPDELRPARPPQKPDPDADMAKPNPPPPG
jgi:hypothetical protein